MRILLTGGGSGGHVFPLIAVARKLKEASMAQDRGEPEFLFIGATRGFKDVFKKEGIGVRSIFIGKVRRYFSFLNFIDILQAPIGFVQAWGYVFLFMPDVVFSKGGYGSLPVVLVSWIFRIPIIIHESDTIPGLSNKILSIVAKRIVVSFNETISFFPEKKNNCFRKSRARGTFFHTPRICTRKTFYQIG